MKIVHNQQQRIAIVGGGLAGLHAAWRLEQRGMDFELFEARSRWGGRILGTDDGGVDLGPTWFWPGFQPRITRLLEELQVPVFPQYQFGSTLIEHWNGQIVRHASPLMADLAMRIEGGTSRLITALLERIPQARRHRDSEVHAIQRTDQGVTLKTAHGEFQGFQQVWLALPPRLIADIQFIPELAETTLGALQRIPTWMAGHAKYVALYPRPFWREQGFSGDGFSQIGPLSEIHDASLDGRFALFGFFALPHRERTQIGTPQLLAKCRAQLVRLFGEAAASPISEHFQDWAGERLTATAHDLVSHQEHSIARTAGLFGATWAGCLHLIGSETDGEQPGYLEGALQDVAHLLAP